MYTMEVFVGVDIGGSHVSVGYIDSTGQLIGSTADFAIDRLTLKPDELIDIIRSLVEKSKDKNWAICSIGVGCPGWAKNGVLVRASNLPHIKDFDFAAALNQHYPNIPVLLLNDADAAVSAEVWGKDSKERYKNFTNIAMVTLGTGIGCGLILNQQLHLGSNGLIEAGHMIVSTALGSRVCGCGQSGCVEAYASAYTTAKRLAEADQAAGRAATEDGVDGGKEVLARYTKGDPDAVKVLEETAEHLAVLCVNLCRVVDPDVIVFTGGLAKAGDTLLDLIRAAMARKAWTILPTAVQLVTAQSIEFGGVVGAALAAKMLLVKQQALQRQAEEARANSIAAGAHLLESSMAALKAPTAMQEGLVWSPVERTFLERSGHKGTYSNEQVPTIEVTNIYELGKIVSLRFLEWVKTNPRGVVALPTGRTPEFFIKTLERYKSQWHTAEVQSEVKQLGFQGGPDFPDTTQLRFVMLDEFFPMHSSHRNSFCRYIRTYYLPLLGVKDENALTFDLVSEGVITSADLDLFKDPVVDIDLLHREATTAEEVRRKEVLTKVAAYCDAYEAKVASLGGIGFFLGGIGPDGHIAFNQQGDALDSTTRLVRFNYPSAAQAAGDLGGIEISRGKAAITIGLRTITANPDATIIIMAAGEGKAKIVRAALEESRDPDRPASALHGHKGARFYISHGAACQLTARKALRMARASTERAVQWALSHSAGLTYPGGSQPSLSSSPPSDYLLLESYLFEQSVRLNIPVHELTPESLASTHTSIGCPSALLDPLTCCALVACAAKRLREKVEAGLNASEITNKSIVHTGPHHDDVELSYHGAMHAMLGRTEPYGTGADVNLAPWPTSTLADQLTVLPSMPAPSATHPLGEAVGGNVNHFAYLTSGFHSVNEAYLQQQCEAVTRIVTTATGAESTFLDAAVRLGEITRNYDDVMGAFHNAFFAKDTATMDYLEQVIFLRKIAEVWNISPTLPYGQLSVALAERVQWLTQEYLPHHQPGDNIPKDIQILKGCMRETETDRVWACSRMPMNRLHHLRSKFYTDDFFTPMPSLEDDAMPMANLLKARQPHVLTVALDPEGTGPDTHYKVLLVVAAGLRLVLARNELQDTNPLVWGYRNVWFEFEPSDATLMIPVSAPDLEFTHDVFMACFTTQKAASFPSPYHDGPFSSWAVAIQQKQFRLLQTLLGAEYFATHQNERVRNAAGFVFIKAMYANKFLQEVEELQTKIENKKD